MVVNTVSANTKVVPFQLHCCDRRLFSLSSNVSHVQQIYSHFPTIVACANPCNINVAFYQFVCFKKVVMNHYRFDGLSVFRPEQMSRTLRSQIKWILLEAADSSY